MEATGLVNAGRAGTAADRMLAGHHVHAPRGQTGRTVENIIPPLLFVGVRPERAIVRSVVLVTRQCAGLVFRVQDFPFCVNHGDGGHKDGPRRERRRP